MRKKASDMSVKRVGFVYRSIGIETGVFRERKFANTSKKGLISVVKLFVSIRLHWTLLRKCAKVRIRRFVSYAIFLLA
jgi:hypothetical protein